MNLRSYCIAVHVYSTVSAAVLLSCTYLALLHIMYSSELKILLYCSYLLYSVHAVLYLSDITFAGTPYRPF